MNAIKQLEATLATELVLRGLRRAPGPLGFVHDGHVVQVTVSESLYRGLVVTLHDKPSGTRQFRGRDGVYDWDTIADAIQAIAQRRTSAANDNAGSPREAREAPFSMRPSPTSPGHVRVKLSEMELDAFSAMQLYALVQHALPASRR